jgi:hypothetical protein
MSYEDRALLDRRIRDFMAEHNITDYAQALERLRERDSALGVAATTQAAGDAGPVSYTDAELEGKILDSQILDREVRAHAQARGCSYEEALAAVRDRQARDTEAAAGRPPSGVDPERWELDRRVRAYQREHGVDDYATALDAYLARDQQLNALA